MPYVVAAAKEAVDRLGQNVSPNTLRNWPIPYKLTGRDATYDVRDLDTFAETRLAAVRVPAVGKRKLSTVA